MDQNHRETIGSGGGGTATAMRLPEVIAQAGIKESAWNGWFTGTLLPVLEPVLEPFVQQHKRLPSATELRQVIESGARR